MSNENKDAIGSSPYNMSKIMKHGSRALKEIQQNSEEQEIKLFTSKQDRELKKLLSENEDQKVAINMQNEMESEEAAKKLQEEEETAERQRKHLESKDYSLAKKLEYKLDKEEKDAVMQDEELAWYQQKMFDLLHEQEATDYKLAKEAEEQAKAEAKELERELERQDSKMAEKLQAASAKDLAKEQAKNRLMSEIEDSKDMSEEDAITHEVLLWRQPKMDYVQVDDSVQIAAHLPSLIKLNVPIDDDKQAVLIAVEREPIAYAEGLELDPYLSKQNPIKCQTMLRIEIPSSTNLEPAQVEYEYNSDFGILYVYIHNASIRTLSEDSRTDFVKTVRSRVKKIFNFSSLSQRRASKSGRK